jgi:peptidoglycan/LPS O-acetylase OafA/YrhL
MTTATSARPHASTGSPGAGRAATDAPAGRDPLIDVVRAGALGVVVVYHWCFTVVRWHSDGPHASNPIGSTRGLWLLTWVLQVMPLFFVVGGAVHARSDAPAPRFIVDRLRRLLPPALALVAGVVAVAEVAHAYGTTWSRQAALLVLSPLWFLAVYSLLVTLTPLARAAHRRWGEVVPVALLVAAAGVDLLRFRHGSTAASWVAWIVVFGFCHQLGFFWDRLREAPARFGDCLALGGLGGLLVLTNMGLYPRSAVGVPGESISNMGPPTVVIVALCCLQLGLLVRLAPRVLRLLDRARHPRVSSAIATLQTESMKLYLLHGVAMAAAYAGVTVAVGRPPEDPSVGWWLTRPMWLILPGAAYLLMTAPGRRRTRIADESLKNR